MTGLLPLLGRELRRRLPMHGVSLALGLLVVVLPALHAGASGARLAELRGAGATGVAAIWALAIALLDGLGSLAGDLRERRLAFDFRLPVTAGAIWAARLGAAFLGTVLAVALVLGPACLAGADLRGGAAGGALYLLEGTGITVGHPLAFAALALLLVLFLAGLVGLALASRSPWAALDLGALSAFVALATSAALALWRATAQEATGAAMVVAVAALTLALTLASWRQVVVGRGEPDRAHRTSALALAAVLFGIAIPLALATRWLLHPDLADLRESGLRARTLTRDLVAVSGPASGRPEELRFGFLYAPATGKSKPLGVVRDAFPARVSLDESHVAWLAIERTGRQAWTSRLLYASTETVLASPPREGLFWSGLPFSWTLSPGGSQVASVWKGPTQDAPFHARIEGLADASPPVEIQLWNCRTPGPILFLSEDRLRYACGTHDPSPWNDEVWSYMVEIDLLSRAVRPIGETPYTGYPLDTRFARAPGSRFEPASLRPVRDDPAPGRNRLVTAAGSEIGLEPPGDLPGATVGSARFLADGRLAVLWRSARQSLLVAYDSRGTVLSQRSLGGWNLELFGEQAASGILLVGDHYRSPDRQRSLTALRRLPLDDGPVEEIARDLRPWRPESVAAPTTLFSDESGRLLWLDLERGELVPLLR